MFLKLLDAHQWLITIAYPIINSIVLVAYAYGGFASRRFRGPMWVLACAALLLLVPQMADLVLKIQKDFGILVWSKATVRALWPMTALSELTSFAAHIVGVTWLVKTVVKKPFDDCNKPNQAVQ